MTVPSLFWRNQGKLKTANVVFRVISPGALNLVVMPLSRKNEFFVWVFEFEGDQSIIGCAFDIEVSELRMRSCAFDLISFMRDVL